MSHQSLSAIQMQAILADVVARRSRKRWHNFGIMLGIFLVAMIGGLVTVALLDPAHAVENTGMLAGATLLFLLIPWFVASNVTTVGFFGAPSMLFVILVPLLSLFFWAQLAEMRRRMILSIIQTALETGASAAEMIRIHAMVCSGDYRNSLNQLAQSMERGLSPAAALGQHPKLARYDVCGILALGADEKQTLRTLDEISRDQRNRTQTESNSVFRVGYLLALCCPMIGTVIFIMMWIVPQFIKVFADFDVELPWLTMAFISFTVFPIDFWFLFAPIVPVVIVTLMLYLFMQTDAVSLRPFGLRRLFRNIDAARFLRIFSTGLKNQVPIPDSIDMYHRVVGSSYLKETASRINKKIRSGGSWIDAFREAGMITAGESRLLESAQRAGNLTTVVDQIAVSKELKHSASSDLVSKFVFTPCLLLIGTLVGLFVIGMFLPMVTLIQALAAV